MHSDRSAGLETYVHRWHKQFTVFWSSCFLVLMIGRSVRIDTLLHIFWATVVFIGDVMVSSSFKKSVTWPTISTLSLYHWNAYGSYLVEWCNCRMMCPWLLGQQQPLSFLNGIYFVFPRLYVSLIPSSISLIGDLKWTISPKRAQTSTAKLGKCMST